MKVFILSIVTVRMMVANKIWMNTDGGGILCTSKIILITACQTAIPRIIAGSVTVVWIKVLGAVVLCFIKPARHICTNLFII